MAETKSRSSKKAKTVVAAKASELPKSTSHFFLNCICLFIFMGLSYWLFAIEKISYDATNIGLLLFICILPMLARDINEKKKSGALERQNKFSALRIFTKLVGLFITYAFLQFIFWMMPSTGLATFNSMRDAIADNLFYVTLLAIPYMIFADMFMPKPKDSYWHVGNLIICQQKADWRMVREHMKSWFIKIFYFLLMTTSLYGSMRSLINGNIGNWGDAADTQAAFNIFFGQMHRLAYGIDLVFAVIGYVMTFKIIGTNIRSSEPTFLGWFVCLICYPPFWPLISSKFINYDDGYNWQEYFDGDLPMYFIWGTLICFCDFIYAFATVAFGYRFSNLTYRGIITGGPYKFTKHPAYFFKNLSWWMVSIPFISYSSTLETTKYCLMLVIVNGIYYMRARTEENHLSNYPEYVAYAEEMNKRSIFRHVAKLLPFIKYSKERADRANSKTYKPFAEQYN